MQITELSDFDYLEVSGPDSKSFLQGQLTCDLDSLSETTALPGAICNIKGRVIANFTLLQQGENCLLQCVAGMGEKLRETLAKYAVFSKVEIQPVLATQRVYGVIGENVENAFAEILTNFPTSDFNTTTLDDYRILRLPGREKRFQIWCCSEAADARLRQLDVMEELESVSSWKRAELRAGVIQVSAQLSEQHTPQLLNYDISGVIDFNKGCYTGQEVVARMYYRGKPKKRLYLLASESSLSGDFVVSAAETPGKPIAEILTSTDATDTQPSLALAILPTAVAEQTPAAELLNNGKYSVEILPMPYTE